MCSDEGACVYGTATIYFHWVPVGGDSPSGPPLGRECRLGRRRRCFRWVRATDFAAIYDGVSADAENYPGNPDYPYYDYAEVEGVYSTFWNTYSGFPDNSFLEFSLRYDDKWNSRLCHDKFRYRRAGGRGQ